MKNSYNIIAHRGIYNNKNIPENSLLAFQKAIQNNIPIELDVQLTKDNVLVIYHDFSLKRMTKDHRLLQDCTLKELKSLHLLNTKEQIPTLKEVLNLINHKVLLDIEVKNTKRITETCQALVKELDDYSNYILKSFNPKIVKSLKKSFPNIPVGYLIAAPKEYANKFYYLLLANHYMIQYTHPDFIAISKDLWKKEKYQKLAKKYKIFLWTIQKKEELNNSSLTYICENLPYYFNNQ